MTNPSNKPPSRALRIASAVVGAYFSLRFLIAGVSELSQGDEREGLTLLAGGLVGFTIVGWRLLTLRDGSDETDLHDAERDERTTRWRLNLLWADTEPGAVASVALTGPVRIGVVSVEPSGTEWLAQPQLGMDVASAVEVARARLAEASREPLNQVADTVFRGAWSDGLAGARLALPSLVRSLPMKGPSLAVVATEDSLLVCEDSEESLREALRLAEEDSANAPPGVDRCPFPLFRFESGGWQSWRLPPTHALHQRAEALAARAVA